MQFGLPNQKSESSKKGGSEPGLGVEEANLESRPVIRVKELIVSARTDDRAETLMRCSESALTMSSEVEYRNKQTHV